MSPIRSLLIRGTFLFSLLWHTLASGQHDNPQAVDLPFDTENLEGRKVVTLRHKASYNLDTKTLSWDVMEADLSGVAKLAVLPGSMSLEKGEPKDFSARLEVRGGAIESQPTFYEDYWTAPVQIQLAPRDVRWNDPLILGDNIALSANLVVGTRAPDRPVRWIPKFDLHALSIDRLETGAYVVENFTAQGEWSSPNWVLDQARAQIFGGLVIMSGQGEWGTKGPPIVSLTVQGHGVALQQLLRAFNSPRAEQVQARIGGAMKLEAVGREWRLLNLEFYGEEGTVFLDRELLYDLLAPAFAEALKKEDVEAALNNTFGNAQMIPFEEMRISGALSEEKLLLELPLKNEPLNLFIEPRVDRELVWDAYDFLVNMGLENIRSREFEVERENPPEQP